MRLDHARKRDRRKKAAALFYCPADVFQDVHFLGLGSRREERNGEISELSVAQEIPVDSVIHAVGCDLLHGILPAADTNGFVPIAVKSVFLLGRQRYYRGVLQDQRGRYMVPKRSVVSDALNEMKRQCPPAVILGQTRALRQVPFIPGKELLELYQSADGTFG